MEYLFSYVEYKEMAMSLILLLFHEQIALLLENLPRFSVHGMARKTSMKATQQCGI